eukprot:UN28152
MKSNIINNGKIRKNITNNGKIKNMTNNSKIKKEAMDKNDVLIINCKKTYHGRIYRLERMLLESTLIYNGHLLKLKSN